MKRISNPVIFVFAAAIVSVAWFTWSAWMSDAASMRMNARVRLTTEKIRLLEQVAYQARALEAAVRGYVITGDTGFLGREDLSEARLRAPIQSLAVLAGDNALEAAQVDTLHNLVYDRIVFSQYLVRTAHESSVMAGAMVQTRHPVGPDPLTQLTGRMLVDQYEQFNDLTGPAWYDRLPFVLALSGGIGAVIVLGAGLMGVIRNVRKAGLAENKLRENEERYRLLIEDAGVTLFTSNRGGFFTYVNSKAKELTGYEPHELVGKQYIDLLDASEHKRLRKFYEQQAFDGNRESTVRFQIRRKNGERRWVEQHVVLLRKNGLFSGYQCIVKDITAEKTKEVELIRAQKEMETLHERFESVLFNTPNIIFIKDTLGRYVLVNKRFESTFGLTPEQVIGRTDRDFPEKLNAETSAETDRRVLLEEKMMEVEDTLDIEGETRYFHIAKFPIRDPQGRVYGLCGVATDITQRIAREHELMASRKKAETAHSRMEHFMANMSHELRTPLNGIIGFTNLLENHTLNNEQQDYLQDIKGSAGNLLVLVNSLLDFSSIRAGKMHLEKAAFDPAGLIRQTLDRYGDRATEKGLRLECEMEDDLRAPLLGDPTRLQQILHNLIDNAIKFTHQGGVTLAVSSAPLENRKVSLRFSVSDTGIGIPEEMRGKVGQVFTQLDVGDVRKYGGIGLGLALTRELIALHNGTLDVQGNPGGGTRIEFSIPYQLDVPETIADTPLPDAVLLPLSGKLILLAEDSLLNQKLAIKTLNGAGATVDLAENGAEAVRMYVEKPYDCILMDIQMPEMDGLEATRIIREAGSAIPIIAFTACALKGDRERCLLAGMNEYVSKPFVPKELFQRVLEAIGERFPDTAPFVTDAWEEAPDEIKIDLRHLKSVAENDREYLLEVLKSFMQNTGPMFHRLLAATSGGDWVHAARLAKVLYASLMIVRIHPLSYNIVQIRQKLEANAEPLTILSDIHLAIKHYKQSLVLLEEEIRKLRPSGA
ncbi:PAS domain S-box protein [Chitinophaga caseinilytica]|uniref:histidine kinase n=1 Tax=Chitinophaga caseinilytica TaxID=2267521 RepID=A0ABZ2Z773_9BACT